MSPRTPFYALGAAMLLLLGSCAPRTTERAHGEALGHAAAEAEHEEDHVEISAEARAASGIEVEPAGARPLRVTLDLPGEIVPNADRLAHIVPRFAGIARQVKKGLGEEVEAGEVLAVIEGNQSLSTYPVNSLISGTVIEKHVTLGEFVRDDQDIYIVADLSSVWVHVAVYARDLARIRRGQAVRVEAVGAGHASEGRIDYVGAVVGETTRAATARVVLPNPGLRWRPGTFVTAHIVVDERAVPVAVPENSVQRIEGRDCVFVPDGDGFRPRPVVVGANDGQQVEIRSGLAAGEPYVVRGGFVLKSELQKSEAGHEH